MKLPKQINIEIDREYYNPIPAQQGDTARVLNFKILNSGVSFDLTGKSVRVRAQKPDGTKVWNDLSIENAASAMCGLKLTNQLLAVPGWCKCQLEITEGEDILSTIIFNIDIKTSIDIETAVESTDEFGALEKMIKSVDEWDKYFEETSGKIEEKYTPRLNALDAQMEDKAKLTINYDDFGEIQNKNEDIYTYPNRINFGELNEAPLVKNIPNKGMDIIGHWYNDFGLECVASSENSSKGWYGWYDWRWNHTTNDNYDKSRHPLLGWYQGDNPRVLDWICYWLAESGVNVVSLTQSQGFSSANWSKTSDLHYWEYVLINNVKNFKSLKYLLSLKCSGTKSEIELQNTDVSNIYGSYTNVYSFTKDNKKYASVFAWDLESVRGIYDNYNGVVNTTAYLIGLATKMKSIGFDGVCIMARKSGLSQYNIQYLESNGVILLSSGYDETYGTIASYEGEYYKYVDNVDFPKTSSNILNVMTSVNSQEPHPSKWNLKGNTPALFRKLVNKAINHIDKYKLPKILTIYNISEWAEGGAGLIPNLQDGFGYLDSIKSINMKSSYILDIEKVKSDTRKLTFNQNKDWICSKVTGKLNGGASGIKTILEFSSLLGVFNSTDKASDYVFIATPEISSNLSFNINWYIQPSFSNGRIYAIVTNNHTTEIESFTMNIMIRRINV